MAGLLKAEGYSELCIQLPRCCVLVQDQSHVLHAELSDVSTGQAPHSKNCARLLEYGVRMRRCDKNAAISGNIQTPHLLHGYSTCAWYIFLQSLDVIVLKLGHFVPSSIQFAR